MTKIFGHRGSKGSFPENTMLSFHEAIKSGVDGLEIDVHLTKDDQLVVIHDERVDRTFEAEGFVKDFTLAELKQLKPSSLYQSFSNYHPTWELERMPTLAEVLHLVETEKVDLNIELKTAVLSYNGIEERILETVHRLIRSVKVVYSSFHLPTLVRMRNLDPHAELAWLLFQNIPQLEDYAATFQFSHYHLEKSLLIEGNLSSEIDVTKIRAWTVNSREDINTLLTLGVETIVTDFPERAIALRKDCYALEQC
ncbi:glycerophosphoryl diester phosphodiesterase [Amphibacillus marinus]|uniref:Glycerophosphoryl diester phosphodiesterase n=1 Tax=Amphibacillus marinus TaxID=872970 RepID=A0A1H8N853_9BACI|nr:glycerophosphodiester phosphodiesterase [Amphibacillus marinus]SEO25668.1 glycerophosphoryl diester phosphodiesterase [Amphibacillus marinus]